MPELFIFLFLFLLHISCCDNSWVRVASELHQKLLKPGNEQLVNWSHYQFQSLPVSQHSRRFKTWSHDDICDQGDHFALPFTLWTTYLRLHIRIPPVRGLRTWLCLANVDFFFLIFKFQQRNYSAVLNHYTFSSSQCGKNKLLFSHPKISAVYLWPILIYFPEKNTARD